MRTADAAGADAGAEGAAPLQLVRAAAALRWSRPDLTATLAELALDSAPDATTWITAAGWLLHGRAALGDSRETACDLLDGLDRWGEAGAGSANGPAGRRFRIELAGAARRTGEPAVARSLLTLDSDDDAELRADALTELARCAVDDAPDAVEDAVLAAEQAWQAAGCEPGAVSVMLLSAGRERRVGRPDAAAATAAVGLRRVSAGGRRAGTTESDHLAAALTAEWIAALVDAGLLEQARAEAVPAANRLIGTARPGRQVARLRLAVAQVAVLAEEPEAVLAALEPAARDAAGSDVPELESTCSSLLGELHESAGRLDAALVAVRAAMAAERRDRDRAAQLRVRLATAAWIGRPGRGDAAPGASVWTSRGRDDVRDAVRPAGAVPERGTTAEEAPPHREDAPDVLPSAGPGGRRSDRKEHDRAAADPVDAATTAAVDPAGGLGTGPDPEGVTGRRGARAAGARRSGIGTGRRARRLAAEAAAARDDHQQVVGAGPGAVDPTVAGLGAAPSGGVAAVAGPGFGPAGADSTVAGRPSGQQGTFLPDGDARARGHGIGGRGAGGPDGVRTSDPGADGPAEAADRTSPGRRPGEGRNGVRPGTGAGHRPDGPGWAGDVSSTTIRLTRAVERVADTADRWAASDGSLIGDALLREFAPGTSSGPDDDPAGRGWRADPPLGEGRGSAQAAPRSAGSWGEDPLGADGPGSAHVASESVGGWRGDPPASGERGSAHAAPGGGWGDDLLGVDRPGPVHSAPAPGDVDLLDAAAARPSGGARSGRRGAGAPNTSTGDSPSAGGRAAFEAAPTAPGCHTVRWDTTPAHAVPEPLIDDTVVLDLAARGQDGRRATRAGSPERDIGEDDDSGSRSRPGPGRNDGPTATPGRGRLRRREPDEAAPGPGRHERSRRPEPTDTVRHRRSVGDRVHGGGVDCGVDGGRADTGGVGGGVHSGRADGGGADTSGGPGAPDDTGEPGAAGPATGSARRTAPGPENGTPGATAARRATRGPATDADGLGLAELLAGALAAYRSI